MPVFLKTLPRKLLTIEALYLALALALPFLPMQEAPDALIDYLPIRDAIRENPLQPSLWLTDNRLYRVPGYSVFLALISVVSLSTTWIRMVHGLLLLHGLVVGKR